jgi:hypothetical protein
MDRTDNMSLAAYSQPRADSAPRLSVGALAETVDTEIRLMSELTALMARLRAAVATDDISELEGCVYSNHRVLMTLGEARRRRTVLVDLLGVPMQPLEQNPLCREFEALRTAATVLHDEVQTTRGVLRGAIECGDALLRAASGVDGEALATYDRCAAPTRSGPSEGLILNQRA